MIETKSENWAKTENLKDKQDRKVKLFTCIFYYIRMSF